MTRRQAISHGLVWTCLAGGLRAQPLGAGPPLTVVTLHVGPADGAGFLHDLADYTNRYGFFVTGTPGGPVLDGRAVFLAWFRRNDGVTMLVTDFAAAEKMQAFFYPRNDGTGADLAAELAKNYAAKMVSYPASGPHQ